MSPRFETRVDHIVWEPKLPWKVLRRMPWEQATIVDVSPNGARVNARTNRAITPGTPISIGSGSLRGLVEVCGVEATQNPSVCSYTVTYVWLDSGLQMRLGHSSRLPAHS